MGTDFVMYITVTGYFNIRGNSNINIFSEYCPETELPC